MIITIYQRANRRLDNKQLAPLIIIILSHNGILGMINEQNATIVNQ